jgi:hypothetical protein
MDDICFHHFARVCMSTRAASAAAQTIRMSLQVCTSHIRKTSGGHSRWLKRNHS